MDCYLTEAAQQVLCLGRMRRGRNPSWLCSLDAPQRFIVRNGIKLYASLLQNWALSEHFCKCVHLFGSGEIGPDADIDKRACYRVHSRVVVDKAAQSLERGDQRLRRFLDKPLYLGILRGCKVSLGDAYNRGGCHDVFSSFVSDQSAKKQNLCLEILYNNV